MKFAFICNAPVSSTGRRIAVVGAGPAGLSATGYLVCRGYEVDVYDKLPGPGGLMAYAIPSWRIKLEDILDGYRDLVENFGVKFIFKTKVCMGSCRHEEGDDFIEREIGLEEIMNEYDAVLIATGTWRSRRLGIAGEESGDVYTALEFLYRIKLAEMGYTIDYPRIAGRRVVVIGGGLSAVDAVETCLHMGATETVLVYRRTIKEAPAGIYRIKEVIGHGARFIELAQPLEILLENDRVKGIKFIKTKLGAPDRSGRPKPVPVPGTEFVLEADLVIEAIGEIPTPPIYGGVLLRSVGGDGRIVVGGNQAIQGTNVFAAGDVVTGPSKIGFAVESGLKAARSIDHVLSGSLPRVSEIISSIPVAREYVPETSVWRDEIGKKICSFLSDQLGIDLGKCLSLQPFTRVFDYSRCMECETCRVVCGFVNNGKSRIRIRESSEGLRIPTSCLHCINPKCIEVCDRKAFYRGVLGELLIDYKLCNDCLDCLYACPLKAIRISRGRVVNCDLCLELRRRGIGPACISMCPSRAVIVYSRSSTVSM